MITIILAVLGLLLIGSNGFLLHKYLKFKKEIKSFKDIGTGRYGFYKFKSGSFLTAYVFVNEIDRYSDGYSSIKINKVESTSYGSYKEDSVKRAKADFVSLKLTNEIEWLESEDHIRKARKEKLEKLEKI